jgi:SPP1 gp7 family putative phage head morphogenesis protein
MDKTRHVAIWLRMLAQKEIAAARSTNSLLKAQGNKIKNAYETGGQLAAFKAVQQGEQDWVRVFIAFYGATIQEFGDYIQEVLGVKKSAVKSRFTDKSRQWVASQAYMKSRYVTKTTHEIVKGSIDKGIADGLSEVEIAKDIKSNFVGDSAANRARTIARTEVHNAASYGMQSGAEDTGLNLTREWVAVSDERTREDHADADGQVRGMDEPFDVGGEDLDYPGDGSPENSINCRCTVAYSPVDTSFGADSVDDFEGD